MPYQGRPLPPQLAALVGVGLALAALFALLLSAGLPTTLAEAPLATGLRVALAVALTLLPVRLGATPPPGGGPASYARWLLPDQLGSGLVVVEETGLVLHRRVFYPFGGILDETANPSEATEEQFTGQGLQPETGLYDYEARWYDPAAGRFLSPDPILPDPFDPQLVNAYSYVRNSPASFVDPTGLSPFGLFGASDLTVVPSGGPTPGGFDFMVTGQSFQGGVFSGPPAVHPISNLGMNPAAIAADAAIASVLGGVGPGGESQSGTIGPPTGTTFSSEIAAIRELGLIDGIRSNRAQAEFYEGYRCQEQGICTQGAPVFLPVGPAAGVSAATSTQLISNATRVIGRGGLSKIGSHIQKHSIRTNSTFAAGATNAENTRLGGNFLRFLFRNGTVTRSTHKVHGSITNVRLPDGTGARFGANGNFVGLLEQFTP